jgi:hypothetical protein
MADYAVRRMVKMRISEIGRDQHRFRLSLLPIRQTGLIEIEDELGLDERNPRFN